MQALCRPTSDICNSNLFRPDSARWTDVYHRRHKTPQNAHIYRYTRKETNMGYTKKHSHLNACALCSSISACFCGSIQHEHVGIVYCMYHYINVIIVRRCEHRAADVSMDMRSLWCRLIRVCDGSASLRPYAFLFKSHNNQPYASSNRKTREVC